VRCYFATRVLTWHGRWDTSFNMTVLRFISFALDLHWARQGAAAAARQPAPATSRVQAASKAERALAEAPLPGAAVSSGCFSTEHR
jgi:hypothetical protein